PVESTVGRPPGGGPVDGPAPYGTTPRGACRAGSWGGSSGLRRGADELGRERLGDAAAQERALGRVLLVVDLALGVDAVHEVAAAVGHHEVDLDVRAGELVRDELAQVLDALARVRRDDGGAPLAQPDPRDRLRVRDVRLVE